ncbi:MAG: helix-turn-helix domain-containing protein [Candidatus Coatesbacteria bacterium]|nr:helix-turn-helix domain-containing protein [Candidatus Coatesbacteria bacterium]
MVLNYLSRLKGGEKISYEKFAKEINVDRKTLMKWGKRYNEQGLSGLEDKSRRPKTSPFKTCKAI